MSQNQTLSSKQEVSANKQFSERRINTKTEYEVKISEVLHELMKGMWGGNFVSPVKQNLAKGRNAKVLDVGCGITAKWLLQLSKDYPLTQFVGLDVLPPLSPNELSRDNLQFVQGDASKGLPFEDNTFDLVHMRFILIAFTEEQWREVVVKELIRVCKPGGWIEILEIEEIKPLGPISNRLSAFLMSHLESRGINVLVIDEVPDMFEDTDQVDPVFADERVVPIGKRGGDLGKLALELFYLIFYDGEIWSAVNKEEHGMMVNRSMKEIDRYQTYLATVRICCQKI